MCQRFESLNLNFRYENVGSVLGSIHIYERVIKMRAVHKCLSVLQQSRFDEMCILETLSYNQMNRIIPKFLICAFILPKY
jgi:hypothetical protein